MRGLKSRIVHLEQAGSRAKPIIVVVGPDETQEQTFARAGIDRTKLRPDQLVVVVDRGVASMPGEQQRIVKSAPFAPAESPHS